MQQSRGFESDRKDAKEMEKQRAKKESLAGERRPKIRKGTSQRTIFQAAFKTNFADVAEAKEWESRYKEKLTRKSTGDLVFHLLARKNDEPDGMRWSDEKTIQFLNWALERHHGLLEAKNSDGYTPLHLAFMQNNDAFIEAVLKHPKLMNLGNVLTQTCQYGNSLHVAIKHRTRLMKLMVDKCAPFSSMFTYGQLSTQDTPLHICMSMDLEKEEEEEDISDIDSDLDSDDDDDDTSQIYRLHSHDKGVTGMGDRERDMKKLTRITWIAKEDPNTPVANARRGSQTFTLRRAHTTWNSPESPSQLALKVVKLLVSKHDSVLLQKNDENRTPYQERIHQLKQAKQPNNEELQNLVTEDAISSFIRSYCVRNFPRDKIMTCLYQPGQERHIEFDLGGLPHSSISEDYLDRLSKHLRFESILKYVALPRLTMEAAVVRKKKPSSAIRKRGRSDLVAMFEWLRKNGVEKIVKVMVIDDQDPSHADSSIEEALSGFGVEIWDWKRLDLSTEVIHKTTREVKEISLYSTGNNAVLLGWASQQGLPNTELFPELEKVNLFIREGLEDRDRLMSYINTFKDTITTQTNNKVKVQHILDDKNVSFASGFKGSEGHIQPENRWINSLVNFRRLLSRAPEAKKVEPVKIAIIDDGVDASLVSLDGKIAIGESFCPYANSTDLMSPYYVPTGNHGTVMATLICRICPEVKLYVARLDERQSAGNRQRQITPKSAADAIRWATSCGVDIISMSWTIETPVAGNQDMENLKSAVREADQKQILMFCSTSDQGSSTKDNCYPGDFEGCIMIGGATDTGDELAWVDAAKVKFLLPGTNAPFVNNEGRVVSYESGSSVATAAASGLAGLLLFCSWMVRDGDDYLKSSEKMRGAFKALASGAKFPRVQEFFEWRFKQELTRADDSDESNPRQPQSYELSRMEWDHRCRDALEMIMKLIRQPL